MAIVSALAVASARIWWVVAYWTPRARVHRRRTHAIELGAEWQRARECPADDAWRQQVEQDIGSSAVTVPMTAELLADAVERGVPDSRRWRRRHRRAIARARSGLAASEIEAAAHAVVRRRRVVVRLVPVAAAMVLGVVLSPALQHSPGHSNPVGRQVGGYRYECSQCEPGAARTAYLALVDGHRIPIVADPTRPAWAPTNAELREAQRKSAQRNSGSR